MLEELLMKMMTATLKVVVIPAFAPMFLQSLHCIFFEFLLLIVLFFSFDVKKYILFQ